MLKQGRKPLCHKRLKPLSKVPLFLPIIMQRACISLKNYLGIITITKREWGNLESLWLNYNNKIVIWCFSNKISLIMQWTTWMINRITMQQQVQGRRTITLTSSKLSICRDCPAIQICQTAQQLSATRHNSNLLQTRMGIIWSHNHGRWRIRRDLQAYKYHYHRVIRQRVIHSKVKVISWWHRSKVQRHQNKWKNQ